MLKTVLAFVMMFYAAFCFAAVDANKASAAELDAVKGIGPALSTRIIDERAKGQFKDWMDLIGRVKGIGEGNAAKLSAEGLTVGGASFKGAAPAAATKKDDKPVAPAPSTAKKDDKPAAIASAAAKKEEKPAASVAKKDEKPAAAAPKEVKADDKAKKSAPATAPASAASAAKK